MAVKLSPSMEDYLKTIYALDRERGYVRVKDIAEKMDITMPSVSGALKNLEKQDLVYHQRYDLVGITPKGSKVAEDICSRHRVVKDFLSQILGLDAEIAEKDACSMEHAISPETLKSLARFLETANRED
jgi:DtxR family Mn-dependent transcriptional regulator